MFTQHVIIGTPPLLDEIAAVFRRARDRGVIFSWGDKIYNPSGIVIEPALRAHEAVHGERQGRDVEGWWRRYINDPQFRLAEEIPAHRAEFNYYVEHAANRNDRRRALTFIAARLAGSLYGNMITMRAAKDAIAAQSVER